MKKRIMSFVLAFLICFSIGTSALADSSYVNAYADEAQRVIEVSTSDGRLSKASIADDMALLEDVDFKAANIFDAYVVEDITYYKYASTETITSIISVSEDTVGNITVDVYEGELHDAITYCKDGRILANGEELIVTTVDVDEPNVAVPMAGSPSAYQYSTTPFGGSNFRLYKTKYTSVQTQEFLKDMTYELVRASIKILSTIMFGSAAADIIDVAVDPIFQYAANNVHSHAYNYAPNSKTIGVKWVKYIDDSLAGYEIYDYRNNLYYYTCEVSASYTPSSQYAGLSIFYERMTIF